MVKNFGGCKQKKQGRKFLTAPRSNKLRLVVEEGEMYGCISKLLGNGMAHVLGIDNKPRLLIIRNKFRGRGKQDNMLKPGTIVLIGNRDWETQVADSGTKLNKCDLLEVYTDGDYKKLMEKVLVDWSIFKNVMPTSTSGKDDDDEEITFGLETEIDESIIHEINEEISNNNNNEKISVLVDDELVDVDDI